MHINENIPNSPITPHVIVDPKDLQAETLVQLATEFVLRENANDSSDQDISGAVEEAVLKLKKKIYLIVFDPDTESVGVVDRDHPSMKKNP